MPKKNFEEVISDIALQNWFRRKLLQRTKTFKRFQTDHPEITKSQVEAKFIDTWEGEQVAAELKLCEPIKRAVSFRRDIDGSLCLRIDTSRSLSDVKREIDFILEEIFPKDKAETLRGNVKKDMDRLNEMLEVYDLVESLGGNVQQAMYEKYPETKGKQPSEDVAYDDVPPEGVRRKYQKMLRYYREIKSFLDISDNYYQEIKSIILPSFPQ